jgi:hypothetical protein
MNRIRIAACCLAPWFVGCTRHTVGVSAISTSPDGQRVVVVGTVNEGDKPIRPLRWLCVRKDLGKLRCQPDETSLPLPRER